MKLIQTLKEINEPEAIPIHCRYGKFRVMPDIIYDNSETLKKLFEKIYILRAEHNLATNCIEYTAVSELFEIVQQGMMTPYYVPIVHQTHFAISVTWEKCKNPDGYTSGQLNKGDGL